MEKESEKELINMDTQKNLVCLKFNKNSEELIAFMNERGGMTQGWNGSLDRLEEYLEN